MAADWKSAKTEYITTNTSYRKIAEKYGITPTAVAVRARREGWIDKREHFLQKTYTKAVEKAEECESARLANLMTATTRAADAAARALEDDQQLYRYLVDRREKYSAPVPDPDREGVYLDERQWQEDRVSKKMDTRALRDLTASLKDLAQLMRDFYNIPTAGEAESRRIAAARLEMEQRKAADGADDGEIRVVVDPEAEEWSG